MQRHGFERSPQLITRSDIGRFYESAQCFLDICLGDLVGVPLPGQHNGTVGVFVARMRNALVQSFVHLVAGDTFAVSANHLKSKSGECVEDMAPSTDQAVAQSACNALRVSAVVALDNALADMDLPDKVR